VYIIIIIKIKTSLYYNNVSKPANGLNELFMVDLLKSVTHYICILFTLNLTNIFYNIVGR
jgi:hypothetical protein